jgi:hypothetical protein
VEPHDAEMTANPPTAAPATRSAAAERMRRHRERRRDGLRCVTIELRETEIDALTRRGFLNAVRVTTLIRSKQLYTNFLNAHWLKSVTRNGNKHTEFLAALNKIYPVFQK